MIRPETDDPALRQLLEALDVPCDCPDCRAGSGPKSEYVGVQVLAEGGVVMIDVREKGLTLALPPDTALELARHLARHAGLAAAQRVAAEAGERAAPKTVH